MVYQPTYLADLVDAHGVPTEVELPVEGSPVEGEGLGVLKVLVVDNVDHGAHHALRRLPETSRDESALPYKCCGARLLKGAGAKTIKKDLN